jgi:hypothetical protein
MKSPLPKAGEKQTLYIRPKFDLNTRCSQVVRDFESENDNVQGLRSKFIEVVVDLLFFGQKKL